MDIEKVEKTTLLAIVWTGAYQKQLIANAGKASTCHKERRKAEQRPAIIAMLAVAELGGDVRAGGWQGV